MKLSWQETLRESLRKAREERAAKLRCGFAYMLVFDREPTSITDEQLKETMEELKKVNLFDADGRIRIDVGPGPHNTVLVLTDGEGDDE